MSEEWLVDAVCPEVGKLHLTSKVKAVYVLIGTISIIAAVFVFTTIFSVRKLRAHPSIMIGYISLFEAISCFHSVIWAVSTMEYIDYFGLEYLFQYTIIGDVSVEKSCYALCEFNQILGFQFFEIMSLGMNIGLCIDLVLTLREPFYPAKRRLKNYLLVSFILAVIISSGSVSTAAETCLAPTSSAKSVFQNAMYVILLSIYILISCFSVVYAARMLSRPGISSDIRSMFMKKHMLYAISFIIIWSLILLNAFDQLYKSGRIDQQLIKEKEAEGITLKTVRFPSGFYEKVWVQTDGEGKQYMDLTFFQLVSFIASISTGFVMGVIRCMEPYFHFLLRKYFKSLFGIPLSQKEIDKKNRQITDTIAAFLNSTLNIELVHIILKAITQECTRTKIPEEDCTSFIPLMSDYSETKSYEIHEIEIKDTSNWKVLSEPVDTMKLGIDIVGFDDDNGHGSDTTIINEDISIEELAPKIFAIIRMKEGITTAVIKESLSPEFNRDMVFKAGEGQGKSGSFFFFSHDRRFIIKTMNHHEYKAFINMFKDYYKHILNNENSLLARIYGIFTVTKEKLMPVHLILMGNTVKLHGKGECLRHIFDLKGSLSGRETAIKKNYKPSNTLKDINLLEIKKSDNLFRFTLKDKVHIMNMIEKDVAILESANIMDYSLLLAVEENPNYHDMVAPIKGLNKKSGSFKYNEMSLDVVNTSMDMSRKASINTEPMINSYFKLFEGKRHIFMSSNMKYVYHIAIIDYLQVYNLDKKFENFVKEIMVGRRAEISAVPPARYAKRYIDFMENQVFIVDKKCLNIGADKSNNESQINRDCSLEKKD